MKPASEKQNNYNQNIKHNNTSLEMYITKHVKLTER